MKNFLGKLTFVLLSTSIVLTTACSSGGDGAVAPAGGGGGGSTGTTFNGNTSPATINDTNAAAIGTSAGESVQRAASSSGLPGGIVISNGSSLDMTKINTIIINIANSTSNLPVGADLSSICTSGTAHSDSAGAPTTGQPYTLVQTYTNCVLSGTTFDGTVTITYDDFGNASGAFSIAYNEFTVIDPVRGATTINMVMECDNTGSCTFNSDFVDSNGVTNRVTNFSITGSTSAGFNGSATFLNGTYGKVSIIITNITYGGGCGAIPNGGSISFQSSNGSSGSITFNPDCTVSGTWNNGTVTGSF